MYGRDEKVSLIRLAIAQYLILGIFVVLIFGLWRLQVLHSDYYAVQAEFRRCCCARRAKRPMPIWMQLPRVCTWIRSS